MPANAVKRWDQIPALVGHAAVNAVVAVAHDFFVPNIVKHSALEFVPVMYDDLLLPYPPLFVFIQFS